MKIEAGSYLFKEGEKCSDLFIVKSGTFLALKKESLKTEILETFLPGSLIGEPFLNLKPFSYSVKAVELSEVEKIDKADLENVLKESPEWFFEFLKETAALKEKRERKNFKISAIYALPAILFVLDNFIRTCDENEISLDYIQKRVYALNGVSAFVVERLCFALSKIELLDFDGKKVTLKNVPVISLLYKVLAKRQMEKVRSDMLLNITDQMILNYFVQAASGYGSMYDLRITKIHLQDFSRETPIYFKITEKTFQSLESKHILFLDNKTDLRNAFVYGDLEYIHALLSLNKIYPLLDLKLPEYL